MIGENQIFASDDGHPGEQILKGAAGAGQSQDEKFTNNSMNILIFQEKPKVDSNQ